MCHEKLNFSPRVLVLSFVRIKGAHHLAPLSGQTHVARLPDSGPATGKALN